VLYKTVSDFLTTTRLTRRVDSGFRWYSRRSN